MLRLKKAIKGLKLIRVIFYLNILCLLLVIIILTKESKNITTSLFPVVNLSNSSSSPIINSLISPSINLSFKDELINKRLTSYSQMYDNSSRECNTSRPLNDAQRDGFSAISELLISLRQQIIPYPNNYFYGRGIVLTVGPAQLKFAKVNLKMIEFSGTRLPVQVNIIVSRYK